MNYKALFKHDNRIIIKMALRKRPQVFLQGDEARYINKWLFKYKQPNIKKMQHCPEILLSQYKQHLNDVNRHFPDTDQLRLKTIKEYVEYVCVYLPKYRKLCKVFNLYSYEVGQMLGYNNNTWHNSYKKPLYIKFLVHFINLHEEHTKLK